MVIVANQNNVDRGTDPEAARNNDGNGKFASRALILRAPPVALSFVVMSAANADTLKLLADPTAEEEALACGCLTVVKDSNLRVLALSMPGSLALQEAQISHAIDQCDERVLAITDALHLDLRNVHA